MAAAPMAGVGTGGDGLAATYAAMQSNLRKQFYGDLVDLRGALLNTMSVAPHRASSLHVKMQLIDSALHMLEEVKASVSNAEMAQLMNMSTKVARAVEAWRSRQPPSTGLKPPMAVPVPPSLSLSLSLSQHSVGNSGANCGQVTSPFGATDLQGGGGGMHSGGAMSPAAGSAMPPADSAGQAPGAGAKRQDSDRFDVLSELVAGPLDAGNLLDASSFLPGSKLMGGALPDIDWDVPEYRPSGNLDNLLAGGGSDAAAEQQRRAAAANREAVAAAAVAAAASAPAAGEAPAAQPRPAPARLTSAEAFLAHMRAKQDDAPRGAGAGPEALGQQPLSRGPSYQQDTAAAAAVIAAGMARGAGTLTSPHSAATSCQQPQGSANSGGGGPAMSGHESAGGGGAGGSVGNAAAAYGSANASPAGIAGLAAALQQQQQQQLASPRQASQLPSPVQRLSPAQQQQLAASPFGSVILQGMSPVQLQDGGGSGSGFASMQRPPASAGYPGMLQPAHTYPGPGQQQPAASAGLPSYGSFQDRANPLASLGSFGAGPGLAPNSPSPSFGAGLAGLQGGGPPSMEPAGSGHSGLASGGGFSSMQYNSPTLMGMQQLGLSDGRGRLSLDQPLQTQLSGQSYFGHSGGHPGPVSSPPLAPSLSLSQQQAAAAQQAAQQADRLSAAMQQFPHAALHAGGNGLASLGFGGDSGNYQHHPMFAGLAGLSRQQQQPPQPQPQQQPQQQPQPGLQGSGGSGLVNLPSPRLSAPGFSAFPMSANGSSMGGLTITTGSQPLIRITGPTVGGGVGQQHQQFSFEVSAGDSGGRRHPRSNQPGDPDGSSAGSDRQGKRKKT